MQPFMSAAAAGFACAASFDAQPPRRRPANTTSTTTPTPRRSALARQHSLSAAQDTLIREAFSLFSLTHPSYSPGSTHNLGVLRRGDVRRCLTALGYHLAPADAAEALDMLDPAAEGFVPFVAFYGYAAVLVHEREAQGGGGDDDDDDDDGEDNYEGDEEGGGGNAKRREVREAYRLFKGAGQPQAPITVADLKRVARELREDVDDDMLWDMVLEANGEARGKAGVAKGVTLEEFEGVMRRAGVFG
ncbi:EF-hand superfamily Ca2+-modulated protein [Phyllosticta citricarpa]|uniref:EF-hand superfamily Ca2+-modulated protein n=1 Tax=Phyllosticta citricarpa TaxID=55181 RepID=A0ABR1LYZ7_9PEZI